MNNNFFRGAGIVICPDTSTETNDKGDIFVRTKYAQELSKILFDLRDNFTDVIDYLNKYQFYGNVATGYNNLLKLNGDVKKNLDDIFTIIKKEVSKLYAKSK